MIRIVSGSIILLFSAFLFWSVFIDQEPQLSTSSGEAIISRDTDWYPLRDWNNSEPGEMNISVYVYRDRNRDGVYDPKDLPMAAVAVLVERPDGTLRMVRTNINGYANFSVMANGTNADIGEPDQPYSFEVQVPPGWKVTSHNARQVSYFKIRQGTPAGMVTAEPPAVIGLAPELSVSGHILPESLATSALIAIGPDGKRLEVTPGTEGEFNFPGQPGSWRLVLEGDGIEKVIHAFDIRDAPVVLGTIDSRNDLLPSNPMPVVLDFDNLHRSVIDKLANGYLGLNWDYLLAIDNQHYQGPGYVNVLTSGHAVGYNSSGYPVTIRSGKPGQRFDFIGAYFSVAWPPAEGETLIIEGWRDQRRVFSDTLRLSHLGPVWFQADYRQIERLRLHTQHYWQFTTDDMLYRLQ